MSDTPRDPALDRRREVPIRETSRPFARLQPQDTKPPQGTKPKDEEKASTIREAELRG